MPKQRLLMSVNALFSVIFRPFSVEILTAPLQIGTDNMGFSAQFPTKKGPGNLTPKYKLPASMLAPSHTPHAFPIEVLVYQRKPRDHLLDHLKVKALLQQGQMVLRMLLERHRCSFSASSVSRGAPRQLFISPGKQKIGVKKIGFKNVKLERNADTFGREFRA